MVLVANAVTRMPSGSVRRSCAPGCGRSLRTITRIPFPNTAGSARSNATSAKQSPPNASEIADHLGWVVNLHRLTRARQSRAQRPVQPGHADRVDQRDTTGLRHDTDAVRVDMDTRIQPIRFTLKVFLAQRR